MVNKDVYILEQHFSKCYSCNNEKQQRTLKMNMTVCEQIILNIHRKSSLSLIQKLKSKLNLNQKLKYVNLYHSVCDNVYRSLTMFSALAAVCTVDCAIEIVLITLHYITLHDQ